MRRDELCPGAANCDKARDEIRCAECWHVGLDEFMCGEGQPLRGSFDIDFASEIGACGQMDLNYLDFTLQKIIRSEREKRKSALIERQQQEAQRKNGSK